MIGVYEIRFSGGLAFQILGTAGTAKDIVNTLRGEWLGLGTSHVRWVNCEEYTAEARVVDVVTRRHPTTDEPMPIRFLVQGPAAPARWLAAWLAPGAMPGDRGELVALRRGFLYFRREAPEE